ncbi:MAG: hypothetical protein DAHOPDDO_03406 [Ignavibacteriaceae bacterium]|nr:hypothetical protein [Ignavibacteriaceae bacterium]
MSWRSRPCAIGGCDIILNRNRIRSCCTNLTEFDYFYKCSCFMVPISIRLKACDKRIRHEANHFINSQNVPIVLSLQNLLVIKNYTSIQTIERWRYWFLWTQFWIFTYAITILNFNSNRSQSFNFFFCR